MDDLSLPMRSISCTACGAHSRGRFFHAGWTGVIWYCTDCSNLRIVERGDPHMAPDACPCGGRFESSELRCPQCRTVIPDADRQLAAQHYVVAPAIDEAHPTGEEVRRWYDDMIAKGAFSGHEYFIQTAQAVMYDAKRRAWRYYETGEI
jgi:hypothetical protein